jgi:putative zinc finger/helix-turn-helix YgiT family protein
MSRPFPWKCGNCGERKVNQTVVDYAAEMEHDGRSYSIAIPNLEVLECEVCHNRTLPDASHEKLVNALRAQAGLLTPEEIREKRKRLGLTQEQFANHLKVAKETVSRWERGGQIQQRAMDLLLRLFFDEPQVRYRLGFREVQEVSV